VKRRLKQTDLPAAVLAMAVVVSLGSMASASAAPVMVWPSGGLSGGAGALASRNDSDPQAVAQWLSRLTDVAKRLHGPVQDALPARAHGPSLDLVRLPVSPSPDDRRTRRSPDIDPRLADLPPPTL
jgi:hypothetical protein